MGTDAPLLVKLESQASMTVYRAFPADGHFFSRAVKFVGGGALEKVPDKRHAVSDMESLDVLREKLEQAEKRAEQYEHRVQRLQNRISYKENRTRRERAHRLITRGAAVESILPQVKDLSEIRFYELMEQILTRPETMSEIERILKGGG